MASLASVGSRAGGDDDVADYGSVVGSSVWRGAPSHMATSSYAAAAGADDDFGDFTSDITSTSDFAPSTQVCARVVAELALMLVVEAWCTASLPPA